MNNYKKAISMINTAKSIAVFSHVSYDCDALGSMFGICEFLKSLGKNVDVFLDDNVNEADAVIFDKSLISNELKSYDLCILTDASDASRLGKYSDYFKSQSNTLRLDHHKGYFNTATLEIVEDFSSASEVILNLIEKMGEKPNEITATYLFAGLVSDTDRFVTSNVNLKTFENAYKLVKYGADTEKVNQMLFKSKSVNTEKMKALIFSRIKIYDNDIAISYVKLKDLKKYGLSKNKLEYSNELIYLQNIKISCLLKQVSKNTYNCSLRSKPGYSVCLIAEKFGGGGHVMAARCTIKGCKRKVINQLLEVIRKFYK